MKLTNLAAGAMAALALGALCAPAHAATVTLASTLDLATPQNTGGGAFTTGWRGFGSFSPTFDFDLAEGDTLDWTVQFKPGQSLTLDNPTFFWLFSYVAPGEPSSDFNATGTLALLDGDGAALFTSIEKTDDEGVAHFGQNFFDNEFAGLPSSITFSGLHYVGTVNDYAEAGVTTRHYNEPQVLFNADGATVTGGAVPEPAAWALMLLGFGGVGTALRAPPPPCERLTPGDRLTSIDRRTPSTVQLAGSVVRRPPSGTSPCPRPGRRADLAGDALFLPRRRSSFQGWSRPPSL